jgi:predicted NodU family carbamoyl transferase
MQKTGSEPVDRRTRHGAVTYTRPTSSYGVLCDTSLNIKGVGFINRMSDLAGYSDGCPAA